MLVQEPWTQTSDLTELAAAKFIESHGDGALGILEDRAEMAEELGHQIAARTWHDMAAAVARRLRIERLPLGRASIAIGSRRPSLR